MSLPRRTLVVTIILFLVLLFCASPSGAQSQAEPSLLVDRILDVLGGAAASRVVDMVAHGKLTYFNSEGPQATFDVTVLRKGTTQVQRIVKQPLGELRQGTNGRTSWNSFGAFRSPAQGRASQFLESQSVRSVQHLIDYQRERLVMRDAGRRGGERDIEADDGEGRSTRYSIDEVTATVTALEFVTDTAHDRYVFSDYRRVQGVLTPFRIERYGNAGKVEETQFTTVQYNTSVPDSAFKP